MTDFPAQRVFFPVLVLTLTGGLWSAESAATISDGWHFTVGQTLAYTYDCTQNVAWSSAGDQLNYLTTLTYRFVLVVNEVAPERATLTATILGISASHQGPGSQRQVDSARPMGERGSDDPLLGHLLALENAVFTIVCNPHTGTVSEVQGGEAVAARIAQRAPSAFAGERSPLQTQAETSFASARLAQTWSQLLATPRLGTVTVALGQPFTATIEQTWTGNAWTSALPANASPMTVTYATAPAPVSAALTALTGAGRIGSGQVPSENAGELRYILHFNALTQAVDQRHTLTWHLRRLTAPANAKP